MYDMYRTFDIKVGRSIKDTLTFLYNVEDSQSIFDTAMSTDYRVSKLIARQIRKVLYQARYTLFYLSGPSTITRDLSLRVISRCRERYRVSHSSH